MVSIKHSLFVLIHVCCIQENIVQLTYKITFSESAYWLKIKYAKFKGSGFMQPSCLFFKFIINVG